MAETTKVRLKLFTDKKSHRVLFAEANKEFVDFLFSIFTLPVGSVARLLKEGGGMVGSLPSLYKSIENMSVNYIQPDKNKCFLLEPKVFMPGAKLPLLLPNVGSTFCQLYTCPNRYEDCCVANDDSASCPNCKCKMKQKVRFIDPPITIRAFSTSKEGYVKESVKYMVMDDLEVKVLCTSSIVTLLSQFNVKDIEEKVVDLGMDEGVKLLQASLQSKTVLTDVFLPAKIVITEETIKNEGPVFRSGCKCEAST